MFLCATSLSLSQCHAGPQYWHASRDENIAYIEEAIKAVQAKGVPVAVYTSESQWSPITGGATIASHLPLWVSICVAILDSRLTA